MPRGSGPVRAPTRSPSFGARILAAAAVLGCSVADPVRASEDLEATNEALRGWLQLMKADRPYLLLDGSAGQLRLQHGAAVLRPCPVISDSLDAGTAPRQRLTARLRRHRRAAPHTGIAAGPFDWEHYLAAEATEEAALLFSEGLLLYADEVWRPVRPPFLRLRTEDLRALYDAAADRLELILLPPGWERQR